MNTPHRKINKSTALEITDKKLVTWFFSTNFYLVFITTFIESEVFFDII
ncbi:hypothetical protein [Mesomycoplasma ovipneumoniae]